MNQYNMMILEDGPIVGLHILQTSAYVTMIRENPGLLHENVGDFYSNTAVEDLGTVILATDVEHQGASLMDDVVLVNASEVDSLDCNKSTDYVIQGETGVRLYSPDAQLSGKSDEIRTMYSMISLPVLEALSIDMERGSVPPQLKKMEATLARLLK